MRSLFFGLVGFFALAFASIAAHAQTAPAPDHVQEISLDLDGDGKMDRAVLVQQNDGGADLHVYLAYGDGAFDLARKPSILKKSIVAGTVVRLASKGARSLSVAGGCGGCSNSDETTLTIIHRGGALIVAGYTYAWDTRAGMGQCDINFLTGKGVLSRGLGGKSKPLKGSFAPVRLADWSPKREPRVCKHSAAKTAHIDSARRMGV